MALRFTLYREIDPAPRKNWLVEGLLGERELSCVFGAPGSGKSVLVGDLAAHVAAGKPWLGRPVTKGAVLYVAAERADLVLRRLAAFRQHHNINDIPLAILSGAIDLRSSPASINEIVGFARDLRDLSGEVVRLIQIDTVSRALAGADENSSKDMGGFVGNLAKLQEATGAHVLVVHHVPQDGAQRLRGHGALIGAVDTTIRVEKVGKTRSATIDKANDSEEGISIAFDLVSVDLTDEEGEVVATAPVVLSIDGLAPKPAPSRKLSDRNKNALEVLRDLSLDGVPLSPTSDLPKDIRAVPVEKFKEELFRRGVLDCEAANPREDFRRIKDALKSRLLAGELDGQIWPVSANG